MFLHEKIYWERILILFLNCIIFEILKYTIIFEIFENC